MAASNELHLVLKGKWFDMIQSGEKKEEYRDCSEYWNRRISRFLLQNKVKVHPYKGKTYALAFLREPVFIVFHRGYTSETMRHQLAILSIGEGKPEWGAEPGKRYFRLLLLQKPSIGAQFSPHYDSRDSLEAMRNMLGQLEEGTLMYEMLYEYYLDCKWAGTPLPQFNPKGL